MLLKNKFLLGGLITLSLTCSNITIAGENNEHENYIYERSVTGVQIVISTGDYDTNFKLNGRIQINANEIEGETLSPVGMRLPMINYGNLVSFNFDPYFPLPTIWEILNNPEPSPFDFSGPAIGLPKFFLDPQIRPPLPIDYMREFEGVLLDIEIPGIGVVGQSILPNESVKKIGKNHYAVSFDTCSLELWYADICGLIKFTVKANGVHTSRFTGTRTDKFGIDSYNNSGTELKFKGKFVEKTADVAGTIFERKLRGDEPPGGKLDAVISTHTLINTRK